MKTVLTPTVAIWDAPLRQKDTPRDADMESAPVGDKIRLSHGRSPGLLATKRQVDRC